jgi:hypothetical protein
LFPKNEAERSLFLVHGEIGAGIQVGRPLNSELPELSAVFSGCHTGSGATLRPHDTKGVTMSTHFINDPNHWHRRAEEMRTLAEQMNDNHSKQTMLRIAGDYERLARRAKERAAGLPPSSSSNRPGIL